MRKKFGKIRGNTFYGEMICYDSMHDALNMLNMKRLH